MSSFCLRSATEINKLVSGPGICICDACVEKCSGILGHPAPEDGPLEVPVWEGLSKEEMLNELPRISAVAEQVEHSMNEWVAELRHAESRGPSR